MQAKVSWIGYLRFVIIFLLVGLLVTQFASIPLIWAGETLFGDIGVTVMSVAAYIAAPLLCLFYCLYRLFHFRAYTDDEGVWFYSGYFPWSEGIRGVRWENFDRKTPLKYYSNFSIIIVLFQVPVRFERAFFYFISEYSS